VTDVTVFVLVVTAMQWDNHYKTKTDELTMYMLAHEYGAIGKMVIKGATHIH